MTDYESGPYRLKDIQITGPYREVKGLPEAWFFRDDEGRIELHLQIDGPLGVNHITMRLPKPRKTKPQPSRQGGDGGEVKS